MALPAKTNGEVVTKWKKVFMVVMNASYSQHMKNGPTCKDKWGAISRECKKNFLSRIRNKVK
jgi:hypothetical protein